MYKEMYGEELNLNEVKTKFTTGTTFGGSTNETNHPISTDKMIVQKEGHEQSGGTDTDLNSVSNSVSDTVSDSVSNESVGTKVIKI
jgi:hypothetical protein